MWAQLSFQIFVFFSVAFICTVIRFIIGVVRHDKKGVCGVMPVNCEWSGRDLKIMWIAWIAIRMKCPVKRKTTNDLWTK